MIAFDAHDDALGVDLVHDAFAPAEALLRRSRAGRRVHAGADQRRFAAD